MSTAKTSGSLWNYHWDKPNSSVIGKINYSIKDSKHFDHKTSIPGGLEGNDTEKDVEIVVPLKYLSNIWRTLDEPVINCEINKILTWFEDCVVANKATSDVDTDANLAVAVINNPTYATSKITHTKLNVLVVTW